MRRAARFRRAAEAHAPPRTVLLSSNRLDEVEKTCDVAAIVYQGHERRC